MPSLVEYLQRSGSPLNDPRAMVGKAPKGRPVNQELRTLGNLARTLAEVLGPQADINDMVELSRQSTQAAKGGRLAEALLATGAAAVAPAMAFFPGSIGGIIRAYHGSPHDFTKFDISKIGTGEGAQTYGHGMYFAENPSVAETYRDILLDKTPSRVEIDIAPNISARAREYIQSAGMEGDKGLALQKLQERLKPGFSRETVEQAAARKAALREAIEAIESGNAQIRFVEPKNRLYTVDINADPEDFLDWDKPLSEQSRRINDALGEVAREAGVGVGDIEQWGGASSARAIVRAASEKMGDDVVAASLNKRGIKGIRYLDQGSRKAGEGTYNYVVFDDSLIDIVDKK